MQANTVRALLNALVGHAQPFRHSGEALYGNRSGGDSGKRLVEVSRAKSLSPRSSYETSTVVEVGNSRETVFI